MTDIIYFDNAATSWPKPREMTEAVADFYENGAGNPGRSGHRLSVRAGEAVEDARDAVAALLGAPPLRVALTPNATYALNMALLGMLEPGDRVVCSPLEHNSVARPLRRAEKTLGVTVETFRVDPATGAADLEHVAELLERPAGLLVFAHGSNVSGTIQPAGELCELARESGTPTLIDAAQTAGAVPIDVVALGCDMMAFTCHKAMLGPMGTGGLYVRAGLELKPTLCGGTGSASESDEHPAVFPDVLEPGTPDAGGSAGLAASARVVAERGPDAIAARERGMAARLIEGLLGLDLHVLGPLEGPRLPVVSFTAEGRSPKEIAEKLDREHCVMCRPGLHCSPWAHRAFGTFPEGAVRMSLSVYNTPEQVDEVVSAMRAVLAQMAAEDRVLLFPSTRHAIRAEKALKAAGVPMRVIPAPSRYTADCGIAVAFLGPDEREVMAVVEATGVEFRGPLPL